MRKQHFVFLLAVIIAVSVVSRFAYGQRSRVRRRRSSYESTSTGIHRLDTTEGSSRQSIQRLRSVSDDKEERRTLEPIESTEMRSLRGEDEFLVEKEPPVTFDRNRKAELEDKLSPELLEKQEVIIDYSPDEGTY